MNCEKEQDEDLYGFLALFKDVDEIIFPIISKQLKRKKIQDCFEFLQQQENQCIVGIESQKIKNLSLPDKEFIAEKKDIKKIIEVLKKIKDHQFNNKISLLTNMKKLRRI
ncbi:unnamed protein product (macronuclear) [Paramecium tetraurelia]|uniref:Uncharacterized protein n=1 Tax=Paramecium tetraurelia TaxID=5888 RepID=A0BID3_PARTE|nr:uncharacterized protein GSPATT00004672001 [Paramecium tetraurelia]CAK58300.1 unnamed protein product [Paramecium tetraurelia]|eukprot:XP_001425698.1 hypothetical protein (macronuclear) [Paramecium tetraurelia strain d4-2]